MCWQRVLVAGPCTAWSSFCMQVGAHDTLTGTIEVADFKLCSCVLKYDVWPCQSPSIHLKGAVRIDFSIRIFSSLGFKGFCLTRDMNPSYCPQSFTFPPASPYLLNPDIYLLCRGGPVSPRCSGGGGGGGRWGGRSGGCGGSGRGSGSPGEQF